MAQIIDGKAIAAEIRAELKDKVEELFRTKGFKPGLALLLVGEDPASKIYVNMKGKACAEIGIYSITERMAEDVSEEEVLNKVKSWNDDPSIHGILVQLPLPKHIDTNKVIDAIDPLKDVDGFHPVSAGNLMMGKPGFVSCTPAGIMELIRRTGIETSGKHVVVVGRSNIVGRPVANLLSQKAKGANAIVTLCHSAAKDLSYYTKQADIIIAAIGVPELIKGEDVKEGVAVIDVGINRVEDASLEKGYRMCGDCHYESVSAKASFITPVPGGVGPMTIAMLMNNTYLSALQHTN
jgi:methylenetetrahydrofolate dehydrogenase (NADP+)/methenyltetrahydrofolate cyclohydrolase